MKRIFLNLAILVGLTACSSNQDYNLKSPIIQGVNYVGVSVSDIDASTEFYTEPAALNAIMDTEFSSNAIQSRLLRSVNGQLRLMQFRDPVGKQVTAVQGPGIAHVCFQVAAHTAAYEKFLEKGGRTIGDPEMVQLSKRNPVEYAYIKDNDGNIVEVEHVRVAELNRPKPPKNTHRIRHVALATPDLERLVKFYSALLDEPKPRRIGKLLPFSGDKIDRVSGLPDSKLKMAWFQIRNMELELAQYFSHPTEVPTSPRPVSAIGFNMIVFDVNDLEAAKEKFVSIGGALESQASDLQGGDIFFGRDPDGNLLGFQSAPPTSIYSSQNFDGNGT